MFGIQLVRTEPQTAWQTVAFVISNRGREARARCPNLRDRARATPRSLGPLTVFRVRPYRIDQRNGNSGAKDAIARRQIVVTNDLQSPWGASLGTQERDRGVMKLTDQPRGCDQYLVIVPAELGRNLALDMDKISLPLSSVPRNRGAPSKPSAARCSSSTWTNSAVSRGGRRTVCPTRTTEGVVRPP
jgi:hypothetical protein